MTEVLSPKSTPVATEDMAKFARKSHAMRRSQYKMFNSNRAHNYSIEKLLIDNEVGVVSLTTEIERLGGVVNPAGPGQHVPLVEHKPKLVKERRRCHIHHVPFAIPFVMELYLNYHCVYTLNLMPTNTLGSIEDYKLYNILVDALPGTSHQTLEIHSIRHIHHSVNI